MKSLLLILLLSAGISVTVFAQSQDEFLKKENINDTLLKTDRTLIVPEPFNAQKVLLQLFRVSIIICQKVSTIMN